jgi:hypothetical protein
LKCRQDWSNAQAVLAQTEIELQDIEMANRDYLLIWVTSKVAVVTSGRWAAATLFFPTVSAHLPEVT